MKGIILGLFFMFLGTIVTDATQVVPIALVVIGAIITIISILRYIDKRKAISLKTKSNPRA
jgi:uncharacterized membrane-anchored protein